MITSHTREDIIASFSGAPADFHSFWQVTLKLTDGCTLSCAYCNQFVDAKHRTEFDFSAIRTLVEAAGSEQFIKSILLTGGEPLLYSRLASLLRLLTTTAIPFDINTALFVGHAQLDLLFEYPPRVLRFSLQGSESSSANLFYGRSAWNTVVRNAHYLIERLKSRSIIHVNLGVTRNNYRHLARDVDWIIDQFDPSEILFCPTISCDHLQLDAAEVRDYYANTLPQLLALPRFRSMQHAPWRAKLLFGAISLKSDRSLVSHYPQHVARCHAGYTSVYVDNFLNVYPCITHQVHRSWPDAKPLGTLAELDFLRRLRRTRVEPCLEPCQNAVCRSVCPHYLTAVNQFIADFLISSPQSTTIE